MNKDESLKIGMYTEEEIFQFLTKEGGMLGRSMYDAIFDKIHALITEKEQLKSNWERLKEDVESAIEEAKLNNYDIPPMDEEANANRNFGGYYAYDYILAKMNELEGDK